MSYLLKQIFLQSFYRSISVICKTMRYVCAFSSCREYKERTKYIIISPEHLVGTKRHIIMTWVTGAKKESLERTRTQTMEEEFS